MWFALSEWKMCIRDRNHIGTREIATERLTLRRFEIEDAENMFYNWANDTEVTKYLTWPAHELSLIHI